MKQHASRRGLSLLEVIVVIAILGIVVACILPALRGSRRGGCGYRVQCQNNLKQLYSMAMIYSDRAGGGFYPIAPGEDPRAHESLQLLVNSQPDLDPRLFVCPEGEAVQAEKDEESGKYVLEDSNLDFAWVAKLVKNTATDVTLCSDKYIHGYKDANGVTHGGHVGGFNVLLSDGSVAFIKETDPLITGDKLPKGLTR